MSNEVEEIKRRIDIVDLVSSYLTLKKTGANWKGLCPFHSEKTGSFMVSQEKQIFKCFGCGEGGSVFDFIMKMENLNFREALEMLAARAGVQLAKRSPAQIKEEKEITDRKTRLFQINALSAQFFHKVLTSHPAGKSALDYLKNRKLTDDTIQTFLIGWAPSPDALRKALALRGFSPNEIQAAGSPDRFWKRIIFPIRDVMGNILGFTGRTLDKAMEPKYLNTPESEIFHKGRILYNLDKARGDIKTAKATVVVEGQMDVISSWQAGVKNVVATSGTALTADHLQILYRYTPNIVFAFDADTAGTTTAKKAHEMALTQGMNVKMTILNSPVGEFKDPGEMIEKDPAIWPKTVEEAKPVIDWYLELAFSKQLTANSKNQELTSQEKKEIAKEILPIISKIPDSIEQAHYIAILAKKLEISEQTIFSALNKANSQQQTANSKKPSAVSREPSAGISPEEILIAILFKAPEKMKNTLGKISNNDFQDEFCRQVYSELAKCYNENKKAEYAADIQKKLELLIFEIEKIYSFDEFDQIIQDLIHKIKQENLENIKHKYARQIKQAEESGDTARLKELIKELQDAIK